MKAIRMFLLAGVTVMVTGCSSQRNIVENTAESTVQTEVQTTGSEESTEATVTEERTTEQEEKEQTKKAEGISSDDNFSVDMEDAGVFAGMVKETVAQKDLEALADMTAYPIYVNFQENGKSIENREALIALGTDEIFTEELVNSVNQADEKKLSPSKAGFVLTKESGAPNIVFGLRDGNLAILGINY